jgi:transcriptional regulator with XRE-family HTH domain
MKIHEQIRKRRKELGISQERLAFDLEIDQSGYSKLERGVNKPGAFVLRKILEYLKMDVKQ